MRTLTLRGGARIAVRAADWHDAFGTVTHGRVQLELHDGRPGPVLGRDAGFWLRGTGVRALRNPGRRTATVHVAIPERRRNDMTSLNSTLSERTAPAHRLRGVIGSGVAAALAATTLTTVAAALAAAGGVDFAIPDGGGTIPPAGFAVMTGFFSLVGVALAVALRRWSARPAHRFVAVAVALTVISLVPPLLSGAGAATVAALVGLHLVPAAVMIPALARSLRTRTG